MKTTFLFDEWIIIWCRVTEFLTIYVSNVLLFELWTIKTMLYPLLLIKSSRHLGAVKVRATEWKFIKRIADDTKISNWKFSKCDAFSFCFWINFHFLFHMSIHRIYWNIEMDSFDIFWVNRNKRGTNIHFYVSTCAVRKPTILFWKT